jgi:hypothetical protein
VVEKHLSGKYVSHGVYLGKADNVKIIPDKKIVDPSPKAQDVKLGERLWSLSNEMLQKTLGITF